MSIYLYYVCTYIIYTLNVFLYIGTDLLWRFCFGVLFNDRIPPSMSLSLSIYIYICIYIYMNTYCQFGVFVVFM